MNPIALVILLIVLALSSIAFFLTQKGSGVSPGGGHGNPATGLKDKTIVPAGMLSNALSRISIDNPGRQSPLTVDVKDGRWNVFVPHPFPAKTRAIDELLGLLAALEGTRIDGQHDMLGDSVGLVTRANIEMRISLGPRLGGGRGILFFEDSRGTTTYNASDALHDYLDQLDPASYFDDKLPQLLMPEIRQVRIETPDGKSMLNQIEGKWSIGQGRQAERALAQGIPNHPGVSDYFALFEAAEALEMQTYSREQGLAKFGLDKPLISAHFTPATQKHAEAGWRLNVGVPADPQDQTRFISFGWFDDPHPAVFTVATPVALAFSQRATAFRDPRLVSTPASLIESVKFFKPGQKWAHLSVDFASSGTTTLTSLRAGGQFGGLSVEMAPPAAKTLLNVLTTPTAEAYTAPAIESLNPLMRVELQPRLGAEAESLAIFADPESEADLPTVLVHRENEPVLLRIDRATAESLLDPAELLADN